MCAVHIAPMIPSRVKGMCSVHLLLQLQYLKKSTYACSVQTTPAIPEEKHRCVQCSDCLCNTLRGAPVGVCSVQFAPAIP